MSEKFKELIRYSLKEFYECTDEEYTKVLNKITDGLIDIAHENGFVDELGEILDELKP